VSDFNNKVARRRLPASYPLVLIVEDDKLQQKLYNLIAEQVQMMPVIVDSCRDAVEAATSSRFDLIFLDLQMPDSNGIQCADRLRLVQKVRDNGTPIIAVTAHAMPGDRERCLSAGMDDYLSKPFTLLELKNKISQWSIRRSA
jgi:CheY-like chemotaxis protein